MSPGKEDKENSTMTLRSRLKFLQRTCPPVVACRRPFLAVSGDVCVWVLAYFLNPREINSRLAPWHLGLISTRLKAYPPILDVHRESVSGWGGFSLGVLIASCTENSNLEYTTKCEHVHTRAEFAGSKRLGVSCFCTLC